MTVQVSIISILAWISVVQLLWMLVASFQIGTKDSRMVGYMLIIPVIYVTLTIVFRGI